MAKEQRKNTQVDAVVGADVHPDGTITLHHGEQVDVGEDGEALRVDPPDLARNPVVWVPHLDDPRGDPTYDKDWSKLITPPEAPPEVRECELCGAAVESKSDLWCVECREEYKRISGWPVNEPAAPTPGAEYK